MRKFLLLVLALFLFSQICYAQTIIALKSGKTVEGTLIERNDQYIKINFSDVDITYWLDEVESIQLPDGTKIIPSAKVQSQDLPLVSQTITTAPSEHAPTFSDTSRESAQTAQEPLSFQETRETAAQQTGPPFRKTKAFPWIALAAFLFGIAAYAFFSFCLIKIAVKTNTPNSWFAWIPIMNIILMCDIAEKPRWWAALFLLGVIPYIGLLATVVLNVILMIKICNRMGKPTWWGYITIIPMAGLVIFAMLAFGKDSGENIVPYELKENSAAAISKEDTTHEKLA